MLALAIAMTLAAPLLAVCLTRKRKAQPTPEDDVLGPGPGWMPGEASDPGWEWWKR